MRTSSRLCLALAVCAIAAAAPPAARAETTPPDSMRIAATSDSVFSLELRAPAAESIHVFLLTQLAVTAELARDSVAVQALIRHAVVTIMVGLNAEQIDVASGMVFIRDAGGNSRGSNYSPTAARGTRTLILAGYRRGDRLLRLRPLADSLGRTSFAL